MVKFHPPKQKFHVLKISTRISTCEYDCYILSKIVFWNRLLKTFIYWNPIIDF